MLPLVIILRPISWLYGLILKFRHRLYDTGLKKSSFGPVKTIVIGNLELGGTGKTPFAIHLLGLLKNEFAMGFLSRGYGRRTSGFVDLDIGSAVDEVGDEPLLVKQAHPEVRGAVCEDRLSGLSQLLAKGPLDFVVLDDAFQHRQLRSGFNILLTPFDRPFWSNHLLPEGTLRDVKRRVRAAHSIVITKCPTHISEKEMADYREKAEWHSASPVHFTTIDYGHLIDVRTDQETMVWPKAVVLFSGIANNTHLQRHVNDKSQILSEVQFKDHHLYGNEDVKKLKEICSKFAGRNPVLVTTSKDAVKLRSEGILNEFEGLEIYELPMRIRFLSDGFDEMLRAYARANKGDR